MKRYKQMIDAAHKGKAIKVWFNSRPLTHLPEEKKYVHHIEIEALPTGGWGYMYFPLNIRFVRTFGLPTMGMTARFHKSWADFGGLKPEAALLYECGQSITHGARCSVGDQLHPRGRLDRAAYELIGKVYGHVEACEPWCDGAQPVTEIAVIRQLDTSYHPQPGDANEGVVRALQQLRHQFDFIPAERDLGGYRLVIVPEAVKVTPALKKKLESFAKKGGAILFSGAAGVADGKPVMAGQGIKVGGDSPFQTTYLRFDGAFADGIAAADHVMYERGLRLQPTAGAKGFVKVVEPYFDRNWRHFSSHNQTPPARVSRYVAAVQKGRIVTVAFPIFKAYATHANLPYRHLIAKCLEALLPAPLLRAGGPSFLEATVTAQPKRTIVHVLAFCPQRRAQNMDIVEEPTDVRDLPVSLRLPRAPKRVTCRPSGEALPFVYRDGRAEVVLPRLLGHAMIVFE